MGKLRTMSALGLGRLQTGTDDPVGAGAAVALSQVKSFQGVGEALLRAEEKPADMAASDAGTTPGSMSSGSILAFQASSVQRFVQPYELMMFIRPDGLSLTLSTPPPSPAFPLSQEQVRQHAEIRLADMRASAHEFASKAQAAMLIYSFWKRRRTQRGPKELARQGGEEQCT